MKGKRRDIIGMRELIAIAKEVDTSRETIKQAIKYFRGVLGAGNGVKHVMVGRSYTVFEISSLYIASRGMVDERPTQDYIDAAHKLTKTRQSISVREINRAVTAQRGLLHLTQPLSQNTEEYMRIIVARAELSDLTHEKALELLETYKDVPAIRKRHPRAIAAGMLHVAIAMYHTDEMTQPTLAGHAGVSTTTIRQIIGVVRRKNMKKKVAFVVKKVAFVVK